MKFRITLGIASVSLLADSVDFRQDASINLLIAVAVAFAWSARNRTRLGMVTSGL